MCFLLCFPLWFSRTFSFIPVWSLYCFERSKLSSAFYSGFLCTAPMHSCLALSVGILWAQNWLLICSVREKSPKVKRSICWHSVIIRDLCLSAPIFSQTPSIFLTLPDIPFSFCIFLYILLRWFSVWSSGRTAVMSLSPRILRRHRHSAILSAMWSMLPSCTHLNLSPNWEAISSCFLFWHLWWCISLLPCLYYRYFSPDSRKWLPESPLLVLLLCTCPSVTFFPWLLPLLVDCPV